MLSRRTFFKTAGVGTAVAVSGGLRGELLTWAEPPRASEPGGPIALDSNENAYGPFPSVLALPNPFQNVNRYPDHHSDLISERLATRHAIDISRVVTGCGSTEILRMAATAFTGPGRKLVMALPTFEAIGSYAQTAQAEVVKVPLAADFTHDLGAMLRAAGNDAGLVYICNPNNPTGNYTPRKRIEDFVQQLPRKTFLLIDEAYHDFVPAGGDYASFIDQPLEDGRVIISRTFSKVFGLAGMRLGYGVTSKETAALLRQHRVADSLNVFVMRCALVAMEDSAAYHHAVARNAADRDEFMRQAAARKIKPIVSCTNFVMIETGRPIEALIDYFAKNNIRIGRAFAPMDAFARISLGTPPEMRQFWHAWDSLPGISNQHSALSIQPPTHFGPSQLFS